MTRLYRSRLGSGRSGLDVLTRKLTKMQRYARWRFAGGDRVAMWWHIGRPNFGDDLNPACFEALTGTRFRFASDRANPHVLGMGSILAHANAHSLVCGSGLLHEPDSEIVTGRVVSVRGHLSRRALKRDESVLVGDPAVLVSELFSAAETRKHRFGYIPHVRSVGAWRAKLGTGVKLIYPGGSPTGVIAEIGSCEVVLSQSLHGLIIADALRVPSVWIAPSDMMTGGCFKFDDYFSTLDAPKEMVLETAEVFTNPRAFQPALSHYRYDKQHYRAALSEAVAQVPQQR